MPYIHQDGRDLLDPHIDALADALDNAPSGHLNYAITRLVVEWLGPEPHYADYNAAMGVLTCAQAEMYRENVAKYEDRAKVANGRLKLPSQRGRC